MPPTIHVCHPFHLGHMCSVRRDPDPSSPDEGGVLSLEATTWHRPKQKPKAGSLWPQRVGVKPHFACTLSDSPFPENKRVWWRKPLLGAHGFPLLSALRPAGHRKDTVPQGTQSEQREGLMERWRFTAGTVSSLPIF